MRSTLRCLLAATLTVSGVAALPSTADAAASTLQLRTLVFDPSGSDRAGDQRQINRETVVVTNTARTAAKVAGYKIQDTRRHTFVFPSGFVLPARGSVTIHSGKGTNTRTNLYWKQGSYVWNNTGDTAYLRTPANTTLDTCRYTAQSAPRGSVSC